MATTINATTTGLVETSDGTAVLDLQTGGTTALRVNASQAIGVGSSPSFGTAGQFLTSQGNAASPTWTTGGTGTVTSVGWTGGIVSVATATTTPAFTIAGTSGGIPYFSSGSTWASSAALTQYALIVGGGAGAAPAPLASLGTSTTVLHGNASGAPTFGAVSLSADVTGNLPVTNLNSGTSASSTTFWRGDGTWATPAGGGGSPGGSTTQVQYNNSGAFGGVSQMTYNGTTVAVSNDMTIAGLTVGRGASAIGTNTAFGSSALGAITTGTANVGIGYNAGASLTTNGSSLFIGYNCGQYTTGNQNTFIGPFCGTGVSGSTTGASNCGIGYSTLTAITTAATNSALGYQALQAVTTGAGNIGIGSASGINLTTGSNNTYVGTSSFNSAVGVSGELVVNSGGSATGKGANTAFITGGGGSSYNGANSAAWAVTSDRRLKKNIVDNNVGLNAINAIQVRNFEYRLPEEVDPDLSANDAIIKSGVQLGVIAQELQQVLPDCVKQESTGVLSVDSDNLTWYMINAIKQLSARVAELESKVV